MYTVPTIVRAIARYFDNLYYLCLDLFSELVYDTVFNRKGIHIVPRRSFDQTNNPPPLLHVTLYK